MKNIRGCKITQKNIADDFYAAYQRCLYPNEESEIVAIPAFTNGFLACEIYLKILIAEKIIGHNIRCLYDKLEEEIKNKLMQEYKNLKLEIPFEDFLSKMGEGFTFWRYIYEDNNKDFEKEYPFQYSEAFLKTFLPVLQKMITEFKKEDIE